VADTTAWIGSLVLLPVGLGDHGPARQPGAALAI
jgi:hypothetical protein